MSRFPNSKKSKEDSSLPDGSPMGGTYSCQTCDDIVIGGVHVRETQEIYWQCSDGHLSKISFRM